MKKNLKLRLTAMLIACFMIAALLPVFSAADSPALTGHGPANNQPTDPGSGEDLTEQNGEEDPRSPTVITFPENLNTVFDINDDVRLYFLVERVGEASEWDSIVLYPGVTVSAGGEFIMTAHFGDFNWFPASVLGAGVHEVLLSYPGNEECQPCQATVTVTVLKKTTLCIENWYPEAARPDASYTVGGTLVDEDGLPQAEKRIMIFVPVGFGYANGRTFYVETDENGEFRVKIDYALPSSEGTLQVIVSCSGDVAHTNLKEYRYIHFSYDVYSVTVSASSPGGSVRQGALTYAAGDTVDLIALPDPGYRFAGWDVLKGGVTVENDSFVMPSADVEVGARFAPLPVEKVEVFEKASVSGLVNIYLGDTFTFTGQLTDNNGSRATVVPGVLSVYKDGSKIVDNLEVTNGYFSFTPELSVEEAYRITFFYEYDGIGFADSRYVVVAEDSVCGFELETSGAKIEYRPGEELDLTNVFVKTVWDSGKVVLVPVTEDMLLTRFDNMRLGTQYLRVEYHFEDDAVTFYHTVEVYEEEQRYTVTYSTGGVCPAPDPAESAWSVYSGCILGECAYLMPDHGDVYEFLGWYLDEDLTEEASYLTHLTGDLTLYASFDGPKDLIERIDLSVAAPAAGSPLCFYFFDDPYSDPLERCGVALSKNADPRLIIRGVYWYPATNGEDYGDEVWQVFTEGVTYALSIELETTGDACFKGHRSAYDASYAFDASKAATLTVNGQTVADYTANIGTQYVWLETFCMPAAALSGDLNASGSVNISDVSFLLDVLAGVTPPSAVCDLNADGELTITDVTHLLDILAGN